MALRTKAIKTAKQPPHSTSLTLLQPDDLLDHARQFSDSIARRAFESNGRAPGRDLENWLRAESDLLHVVHVGVAEMDGELMMRAEVPGFAANELEVSVEPRRVTVVGKRKTSKKQENGTIVYKEHCSDLILRVVDLPTDVNSAKASATLRNGILNLKMPKTAPARKIRAQKRRSGGSHGH